MKLVASADLGGLGAAEGPAVSYHWTRPNLLPALLPWLGILGLLLLPRNRTGQAWWIMAPLLALAALRGVPTAVSSVTQLPSNVVDLLLPPVEVLSFGLAGVWLLLPWTNRGHRFVNALCFGAMLLVGSVPLLMLQLIGNDDFGMELAQWGILAGISILVLTLALHGAGWLCRRRCGRFRFALMFLLSLGGSVLVVLLPILLVMLLANGGRQVFLQMFLAWTMVTVFCAVVSGPFLVLSWRNPLFSQRLKDALRLGTQAPPPQTPAPPPMVVEGTGA